MFIFKSNIAQVVLILSFICAVSSLYEDQAGKFDWKQSYLGKIKYARFDSIKKLVVATESNIIASLHLKNGQIAWRQVLEKGQSIKLLHVDKEAVTVSGNENLWYVRGWDLNTGMLSWEWTFSTEKIGIMFWSVVKNQLLHVIPVVSSHIEVTIYNLQTGQNSGTTSKISASWIKNVSKCNIADSYLACLTFDSGIEQLYYIDLMKSDKFYKSAVKNVIGDAPGEVSINNFEYIQPAILLTRNSVSRVVLLQPDIPRALSYGLKQNIIIAPNGDKNLLLQIQNSDRKLIITSLEIDGGSENKIEVEYEEELHDPQLLSALCRGSACRVLIWTQDQILFLLQLPSGKVLWSRQEALSDIVASEFIELPVSDLDASIEHEFDFTSGDIFGMLYRRILSQIKQVSVMFSGGKHTLNTSLLRDEFGLHKMILVVTRCGKLFALDSLNGNIIWSRFLSQLEAFGILNKQEILLFVQRTARYPPLSAQCILLAKNKGTNQGIVYVFDPMMGQILNEPKIIRNGIKQAMLLPYEDESHLKPVLILDGAENVHIFPPDAMPMVNKYRNSIYLFSVDSKINTLQGYNLLYSTPNELKVTRTWNVALGNIKIVALSMRPVIERVHSQGRVLADRSVLYKYINPNLLALATISDDPIHKHVLSIYLVDGISGLVVYSTAHRRSRGPINLVHSENWLLYSYYNEKFRRIELAAVELYEGSTQSNSTAFSSHAVSQLPHAETQAYILPATPVTMQVTLTERGITSKHILVALSNGAVMEIPWAFLEPRGSLTPSGPEEGFIPYIPELPLPAEATINYNQTLTDVRAVKVAPARLESTCLVLVYGLDMFYTRVTPSKTFDLLKEDFDHWLIAIVLIGLSVASYVTKRLASRKALKQAWK